jgi:hypothetical protein
VQRGELPLRENAIKVKQIKTKNLTQQTLEVQRKELPLKENACSSKRDKI